MAVQLRWVKANSHAVDDAIENSLPRFKHRSHQRSVRQYNAGIEESPLTIAIIND